MTDKEIAFKREFETLAKKYGLMSYIEYGYYEEQNLRFFLKDGIQYFCIGDLVGHENDVTEHDAGKIMVKNRRNEKNKT